jgi:CheY-like chemotaxis protein
MEHDVRQFDGENTGDTGEIIKQLTFLNTQEGLQQCMDDEDFYLDIVSTFVEDNVLEDMQTCYLGNDWSGYRVKVHALKSSSAYIGAEELRAKAKRMEDAAKQEDVEYINMNHHHLVAMYEDLLRNITAVLPKRINLEASSQIKQFTIFVVDDSRLNRQVVVEVLSNTYNIEEAASGQEFFQQLEEGILPDLVLLDVHMPRENGHDIIGKLKATGAKVDALDCLKIANEAGSSKAVNIVLLGRLSHYFDLPEEAWLEAMEAIVPARFLDMNKKAFRMGKEA